MRALVITGVLASLSWQSPAPAPTFILFKYQHVVGKEVDTCRAANAGESCDARVQLDFTGSSIALDAHIETDRTARPTAFRAKGQNSTRSFVDIDLPSVPATGTVFTLEQNLPVLVQERLLTYWRQHGRPAAIPLLPAGEARIRIRGTLRLPSGERLTRYTVHGVTWGNETVWATEAGELVAVVGTDAEEDRFEAVRPRDESALRAFVDQAAADAVEDLEAAGRAVRPVAAGRFAIAHVTLLDPSATGAAQDDVTVLVDNTIAAIGRGVSVPRGTQVIDARGQFLLPGLWDTHAHFEQWEWGPAYLASGVTTVRDVGNEIEHLVPIRRVLGDGRGLGPRMHAAGLIDSDPGSLTSEHAETPERAREIVRRYHDLGFEQIKIYQSFQPALISVVADEAHRFGMTVTGHVPTGTDALTAVRAGQDQINHIGNVTRVMRAAGTTTVDPTSAEARAAIATLVEHHTVVEPTLARSEFNGHPRRVPFATIEPSVAFLPPPLAVILDHAGVTADREARSTAGLETALDVTRWLHQAGVPILAGTDQVVPGFSIARELELLVRAGFTPAEAIQDATVVPAKILGGASGPLLAPGAPADLVLLDANPLEDISRIRAVHLTIIGGRAYAPADVARAVDIRR